MDQRSRGSQKTIKKKQVTQTGSGLLKRLRKLRMIRRQRFRLRSVVKASSFYSHFSAIRDSSVGLGEIGLVGLKFKIKTRSLGFEQEI